MVESWQPDEVAGHGWTTLKQGRDEKSVDVGSGGWKVEVAGEERRWRDERDRVSHSGLNLGKTRKKLKETEVEA